MMLCDAHLDLGWDLLRCHLAGQDKIIENIYLPIWRKARVGLIVAAIYLDTMPNEDDYYEQANAQITAIEQELARLSGVVALCTTGKQLQQARERGQIALLLSLEGAEPIGSDVARLDKFYQRNVRLLGLTWSRENRAGYGAGYDAAQTNDSRGLKPFGKQLVRRAEALGIMIDVSHLNQGGCSDVAAISAKPFYASHSNARALRAMDRNLSDRTIDAIVSSGGMIGVNGFSGLVAPFQKADVCALADHVDYLCCRAGKGRVGLGLDLMARLNQGTSTFTTGGVTTPAFDILPDHCAVNRLSTELLNRQYTQREIAGIVGENWFFFFRTHLP